MKKKVVLICYQFINKYVPCDELKEKKIKYGIETLYNLLTKVFVMLILSIILGIWKQYLLFIPIYALTRRYAYGIHAKKSFICWLATIPSFMLGCYFMKYSILPTFLKYSLWGISFVSFIFWAPADTPNLPLIHPEIRKKQKSKSCIICIIYLLIILLLKNGNLVNGCIYALVLQSICINPLTYKLTKTPFNNYKLYYAKRGLNY